MKRLTKSAIPKTGIDVDRLQARDDWDERFGMGIGGVENRSPRKISGHGTEETDPREWHSAAYRHLTLMPHINRWRDALKICNSEYKICTR